jgi:hypothetical protein
MAANFKITEKLSFPPKLSKFRFFAFWFLFWACFLIRYISWNIIFIKFKMASDVQDGGQKSREHNFEIKQYFCIQSSAMSLFFDQQHDPNSYFVNKAKNGGSN